MAGTTGRAMTRSCRTVPASRARPSAAGRLRRRSVRRRQPGRRRRRRPGRDSRAQGRCDRDGERDDDGLEDQRGAAELPDALAFEGDVETTHDSSAAVNSCREGWLAGASGGSSRRSVVRRRRTMRRSPPRRAPRAGRGTTRRCGRRRGTRPAAARGRRRQRDGVRRAAARGPVGLRHQEGAVVPSIVVTPAAPLPRRRAERRGPRGQPECAASRPIRRVTRMSSPSPGAWARRLGRDDRMTVSGTRDSPRRLSPGRRWPPWTFTATLAEGGHRAGGGPARPGDVAAVGDRELAAVAAAVDGAGGDAGQRAALVGAGGGEALEGALGRLGDHDVLVVQDHAAADRHVGGGDQDVGARRRPVPPPEPPPAVATAAGRRGAGEPPPPQAASSGQAQAAHGGARRGRGVGSGRGRARGLLVVGCVRPSTLAGEPEIALWDVGTQDHERPRQAVRPPASSGARNCPV